MTHGSGKSRLEGGLVPASALCLGAVLFIGLLFTGGCGGDAETPKPVATPEESQQLSRNVSPNAPPMPANPQPQEVQIAPQQDTTAMVKQLNRELAKWIMRNRRTPSSLQEFVSGAQLQMPTPPPGKKFILNRNVRIELVDE